MEELEQNVIKVKDENGNEVNYQVLFTFESEETNKSYVAYTDESKDEEGNVRVFASSYDPNDMSHLEPIETEEEWKVIDAILSSIQEEIKEKLQNAEGETGAE